MGWLRKRIGEPSTLAGLGMLVMMAKTVVPPHYQMLIDGVAVALAGGAVVKADPFNK